MIYYQCVLIFTTKILQTKTGNCWRAHKRHPALIRKKKTIFISVVMWKYKQILISSLKVSSAFVIVSRKMHK